jgi:import inner membrane translocase subunit TIM50
VQVAPYFELVVYTDEQNMYADPIINKLDPERAIPYRLYRQDTQYVDGKHVRDLSKLNRDLSQVLFISANPDAYSFQPENAIKLKAWHGDAKDTTLLDLIPMLQMIYLTQVGVVVRPWGRGSQLARLAWCINNMLCVTSILRQPELPKQIGVDEHICW